MTGNLEDAVYRVGTDPVAFLTIDHGATRDPDMVDVLADAGVEASLFLTGQYVREDPDFVRRLRDETGARIENTRSTTPISQTCPRGTASTDLRDLRQLRGEVRPAAHAAAPAVWQLRR